MAAKRSVLADTSCSAPVTAPSAWSSTRSLPASTCKSSSPDAGPAAARESAAADCVAAGAAAAGDPTALSLTSSASRRRMRASASPP
eukprot:15164119-Alexandrium_andersonii.AAC.1